MKILLLRHGLTEGNEEHRYIGRTDESLSIRGRAELADRAAGIRRLVLEDNPAVCAGVTVYASPMKRCMESAGLLFPEARIITDARLRECDFGLFENKNYKELNGREDYQAWIDSGGRLDFPEGEPLLEFKRRSVRGFLACMGLAKEQGASMAVFLVHGGTIMAVLERLAIPKRGYYDWQVKNGEGYLCCQKDGYLEVLGKYDK